MLPHWQQLRYLSIAHCANAPDVMGHIGPALRHLPHLLCLNASALEQDCSAELDARATGEMFEGITACTTLQVWFCLFTELWRPEKF
jgi:hypothetical protein